MHTGCIHGAFTPSIFFHGATVQAWICQKVKARLASALLFGRRCGEAADEERKYIDEKILEEKTELARKIVFVAWLIYVDVLYRILYTYIILVYVYIDRDVCYMYVDVFECTCICICRIIKLCIYAFMCVCGSSVQLHMYKCMSTIYVLIVLLAMN